MKISYFLLPYKPYGASQKGGILVVSLLLVIVISTFSTAITYLTLNTAKQFVHQKNYEEALFIAEGGINTAIHQLINLSPGGTYTGESGTVGDGTFVVSVSTMNWDRFMIISTGVVTAGYQQYLRCIKVYFSTYTVQLADIFSYTLAANENLTLPKNTTVSGSIRTNGTITCGNNASSTGSIYASDNIILQNSAHIGGNAYANGNILEGQNATIEGIAYEYYSGEETDILNFPIIDTDIYRTTFTVESGPTWREYFVGATQTEYLDGPFTIEDDLINEGTLYITGPCIIGDDLENNGILYITGPCSIEDDMENNGTIYITGPCSVDDDLDIDGKLVLEGTTVSTGTLYVGDDITIDYNGSDYENHGIRGTGIICAEGKVELKNNATVRGTPDDFISIMTTNNDGNDAIKFGKDSAASDCIFYAPNGGIDIDKRAGASSQKYIAGFIGESIDMGNSFSITSPFIPFLAPHFQLPDSQILNKPKIHLWEEEKI